jgi:hypothetical protein
LRIGSPLVRAPSFIESLAESQLIVLYLVMHRADWHCAAAIGCALVIVELSQVHAGEGEAEQSENRLDSLGRGGRRGCEARLRYRSLYTPVQCADKTVRDFDWLWWKDSSGSKYGPK